MTQRLIRIGETIIEPSEDLESVGERLLSAAIIVVVFMAGILFLGVQEGKTEEPASLEASAFIDTYYAADGNNLSGVHRPYTTQAYHDHELAINLGYVDLTLKEDNYRGRLAFQDGTSVEANYAGEPKEFWQYVQEATAGYKLAEDLWFDAGIQFSHIGMESFISRDNVNYTRSLVAEYSPYYQLAGKLTYQFNDKLAGSLLIMNGWQNISDDRNPAGGVQLSYAASEQVSLTYNNFWGYESGTRVFNDLILKWNPTEKVSFAVQGDIGSQEQEDDDVTWHGWAALGQYKITPGVALGGRIERFSDPHGVVAASLTEDPFKVVGLSANIDVEIYPALIWRTEYKSYLSDDDIFPKGEGFDDHENLFVTSLSYTFKHSI